LNRKLLASTLSVGVAALPAVALAAVDEHEMTALGSGQAELQDDAEAKLALATKRAKDERKAELRKKRERQAERAGGGALAGGGAGAPGGALAAIAACESGGNTGAVGGGGQYRGKYQFDRSTWASVGGTGDPASAPEAEQDRRAAMLYARVGASAWPTCGS
jgi:hypothetical protein